MSDPTKTGLLRRSFRAEGNRRLAHLQRQTYGILVTHDLMSARKDPLAQFLPNPGERLTLFTQWFETTVKRLLLAHNWWERFLQRAYESGFIAGRKLTGTEQAGFWAVPSVYRELAAREFEGIAAALIQQVARQTAAAALGQRKPPTMYRAILLVIRKVGESRMKTAVNTMTVQLHNAARLKHYREVGVTRIGIEPELLEPLRPSRFLKQAPPPPQHDHRHFEDDRKSDAEQAVAEAEQKVADAEAALADAESEQEQAQARVDVAEQRAETERDEVSQVEGEVEAARERAGEVRSEDPDSKNYEKRVASAELQVQRAEDKLQRAQDRLAERESALAQAQAEEADAAGKVTTAKVDLDIANSVLETAKRELAAIESGEGLVNVQTAGDDKVCQECRDLADGGPYSIEVADTLLPVHPNCRCALVPVEEPQPAEEQQ